MIKFSAGKIKFCMKILSDLSKLFKWSKEPFYFDPFVNLVDKANETGLTRRNWDGFGLIWVVTKVILNSAWLWNGEFKFEFKLV